MTDESEKYDKNIIFNIPNQITMVRLVLSIVVFVLIPLQIHLAALIVFVIAAATDWVDGYWARKYNQVTQLGRILDPFVDKIIICGTFILLGAEQRSGIAAWMAVVVVGREMLVTALRGFIEQSGGDFSASMAGKLKMVFQCLAVIFSLLALRHFALAPTSDSPVELPQWLAWTLPITVWLAFLSTIYSGVGYLFAAAKMLRK